MYRIAIVSIFALFAYQPLAHALETGAEVGDHVEKGMGGHQDKGNLGGREDKDGDRWRDGHEESGHGITLNFRQRHEHYYGGRGGYEGGDVYHHHYVHHVYGPDVVPSGRRSKSYCPCRSRRHH